MLSTHPSKLSFIRRGLILLAAASLPLFLTCCDGGPSSDGQSHAAAGSAGEDVGLEIMNPSSERPYFHDFGTLQHGEKVRHTFKLRNNEAEPVTIHDLQASCSCSKPIVSYTDADGQRVQGDRLGKPVIVLPPGVVAEFAIDVDTSHVRMKNIDKLAQVRVRSDSERTPFLTFEMHMLVELAFQATPLQLNMKEVPIAGGGHISTDLITAIPGSPVRVVGLLEATPGLEVAIDEFQNFGNDIWKVSATLMPPLELGAWRGEIKLKTTGMDGEGEGRPFVIPVSAHVVGNIIVQPSPLGFSPFSPATGAVSQARVVALAAGHRIRILDARVEGDIPDGLELKWEPKRPDGEGRAERWDVTLTAPPSYPRERFVGRVVFDLDDPNQKQVEAPFIFSGS